MSTVTKAGSYESVRNIVLHKNQDHRQKCSSSKVYEACPRHQNDTESKNIVSGHISDFEKLASVVESLLIQLSFLQTE